MAVRWNSNLAPRHGENVFNLEDADALEAESLGIREDLRQSLEENFGAKELFPIQKASFGPGIQGRDVVAKSRTGSGKTIAFLLPIVQKLLEQPTVGRRHIRAVVVAPTRELAMQAEQELNKLTSKLKSCAVYGGSPYGPQLQALNRGVDVVCATPGRLIDHLERGSIDLSNIETIVLDEADRMLEIGFKEEVESILKHCPVDRQVLLFSATVPQWVQKLTREYTNDPVYIDVSSADDGRTPDTIDHRSFVTPTELDTRVQMMAELVDANSTGRVIIFTKTKNESDYIATHRAFRGIARPIHGDIAQNRREAAIKAFKDNTFRVLVATDVAARGIDIPEVELVLQTWFPDQVETYIHRSGRTGRAGRSGTSVIVHAVHERSLLPRLEKDIGTTVKPIFLPTAAEKRESQLEDYKIAFEAMPETEIRHAIELAEQLHEHDPLALAKILTLHNKNVARDRSLLSSRTDMTTLKLSRKRPFFVRRNIVDAMYSVLSNCGEVVRVGATELLKDGSALADVPSKWAEYAVENAPQLGMDVELAVPEDMEELNLSHGESRRGNNSKGGRGGGSRRRDRGDRGDNRGGFNRSNDRERRPRSSSSSYHGGDRRGGGGYGGSRDRRPADRSSSSSSSSYRRGRDHRDTFDELFDSLRDSGDRRGGDRGGRGGGRRHY